MSTRCLYNAPIGQFISTNAHQVLGLLHDGFHGDTLTTTDEAWMGEIELLQSILSPWQNFHRIVHAAKPTFNYQTLSFDFPNGISEKLKLNKHLQMA